jgi:hypothetical protein
MTMDNKFVARAWPNPVQKKTISQALAKTMSTDRAPEVHGASSPLLGHWAPWIAKHNNCQIAGPSL